MSNPIFNELSGHWGGLPSPGSTPSMFGDFGNLVQQFNQFKSSFQGDPQQEVMKLLQSGQMTQGQLNQLQAVAKQFMTLLP